MKLAITTATKIGGVVIAQSTKTYDYSADGLTDASGNERGLLDLIESDAFVGMTKVEDR